MSAYKKLKSLDVYRLLAMFLVMWGHLIGTGMNAYEIPYVIDGVMLNPIIDSSNFKLQFLEAFLYYKLNTQAAVLGVAMFFVCTGYLVPSMLQRYSRKQFLINRIFRIFPVLVASTLFWGVVVFISQGIVIEPKQYIASFTLLFQPLGIATFMGVLWTLTIEVLFYLVAALCRKIDERTIVSIYIIIVLLGVIYREFPNRHVYNLFYDFRYMGFILLGSAVYCAKNSAYSSKIGKFVVIGLPFVLNLLIFQIGRDVFGDDTTYPNFFTHLFPLLIMLGLLCLEERHHVLFDRIPTPIYRISELAYPVYLTHVCVGLTCMFWLAKIGMNRYVVVLMGVVSSLAVAKVMALLIERPAIMWSRKLIVAEQNSLMK